MESRQEAFRKVFHAKLSILGSRLTPHKLREPCVELSSVGLRFRGNQASSADVHKALRCVYDVLQQLAGQHALNEKLAEYAFFPLAHIFNESKRIPSNVLELAINCLRVLVVEGWRTQLSPQMGKQLVILLTLIVGGASDNSQNTQMARTPSIELDIAGFDCLCAIFDVLAGPAAERTIYHEIGTATVVDQTVYLLLDGIIGDRSDELCISAAKALKTFHGRVTDRVVLASIMPRTVSALAKVLKPTTQTRRSYRLITICLELLSNMLKAVLNDQANSQLPEKPSQPQRADDKLVLDESWLKATATQVKLALTQVIQLRRHAREEVQGQLLNLCIMVVEDCHSTLRDSVPTIVETIVVMSELDEHQKPNNAYLSLKHLATTYPVVFDSLKDSLHAWLFAFPRTMQNNDETAKQRAIKQITTAFQVLADMQSGSDLLISNLTSALCDSVAVAVNAASNAPQPLELTSSNQTLDVLGSGRDSTTFLPVLIDHKSQQQTLKDLHNMIVRLNYSSSATDVARLIVNRIHHEQGKSAIAPLWLATAFLKDGMHLTSEFDEFISLDQLEPSRPYSTRTNMIEELYYVSLPILNEPLADESNDWRVSALALEAVALQAEELRKAFRPELMDSLYPVLQLLASSNQALQRHAMTCLNILTRACGYPDTSTMIVENVDYLVNSVALKLNTFDVSPYPPQVLLMMVKLCGTRLIPYLDDLVDSIFGILDLYHGYPKLVELMFKTLAAIVEEGTRSSSRLAIEGGGADAPDNVKRKYRELEIATLAEDLARRKAKRIEYTASLGDDGDRLAHPKRPWAEERGKQAQKKGPENDSMSDILKDESEEPLPPPREPEDTEKPLSKTHSLLLHIVKSLPSHLTSPSPYLRRSLLSILINVLPVLAADQNSFLPLINDLWPAVVSKISFPSSFELPPSSNAVIGDVSENGNQKVHQAQGMNEFDFQEEIFVTTAACKAVESMFESAGDFMASRVETEFPRWERLYNRAWDKVRQDTDKTVERQAQHLLRESNNASDQTSSPLAPTTTKQNTKPPSLGFIQSLSLTQAGSHSGSRAFTPHHTLWRALISLFLSLILHVRLPLPVGDRICCILGEWIARYAGPTYYLSHSKTPGHTGSGKKIEETEADSIESVIGAMETWNPDLTWFIFREQDAQYWRMLEAKKGIRTGEQQSGQMDSLHSVAFAGGRIKFASVVF